jgi:hypothetical protein
MDVIGFVILAFLAVLILGRKNNASKVPVAVKPGTPGAVQSTPNPLCSTSGDIPKGKAVAAGCVEPSVTLPLQLNCEHSMSLQLGGVSPIPVGVPQRTSVVGKPSAVIASARRQG